MATEAELRLHRCCFTGHRPQKLTRPAFLVKMDLEKEIKRAIKDGYTVFISGMAQGVDIGAAQIVLKLRDRGEPIRLICASPIERFEQRWDAKWQKQYHDIMSAADLVRFICPGYSKTCFQIRNEWTVNHSTRVIAVFNNTPSGTFNTIEYAISKSIQVEFIKG